jgi:ZIP family zinc transporter
LEQKISKRICIIECNFIATIREGLAVLIPLVGLGYNKWKVVAIWTLYGLVEPIGGLLDYNGDHFHTDFTDCNGLWIGVMLFVN